ncbi:HNH endonuclease [Saccharicrinis sp. FJH2]|uniref:HNH endonuclease n=1 Tax=Saccharicrinis sp. FJH65 TaxID=3344659 RepID=UPI0035F3DD1D
MNSIIQNILSLNRGVTKYGPAPHKPILLLAVIESFENGEITDNWIEITDDLFQHFHDIWRLLVKTPHTPNFSLPFYHLKNEKGDFWKLITIPGKQIPTTKSKSIKSFKALNDTVQAVQLSNEFFSSLLSPLTREELKDAILEKYLGVKDDYRKFDKLRYSAVIKKEILYDPDENYSRKIIKQYSEVPKEEKEELIVLRGSIFRKAILEIYDNQCSISGLKVLDLKNNPLVDACHITPFAESYIDTIRNGIAMSPTFHRAFDKGLISISDSYKVLVNPGLRDFNPDSGLRKYENIEIHLPTEERFYPSQVHLKTHRKRFGFE